MHFQRFTVKVFWIFLHLSIHIRDTKRPIVCLPILTNCWPSPAQPGSLDTRTTNKDQQK